MVLQEKKDNSIVVVGSVAYDSIKTPYGETGKTLGGSATYFSISARYFSPIRLIGVVGEDFSSEDRALLENKGIDLSGLKVSPGKTFFWEGEYKQEDINTAITKGTHLNVFERFDPEMPEHYQNAQYLFLANIDPQLQLKVLEQKKKSTLVACDTMNLWITIQKDRLLEVLKNVDIFVLNEGEAKMLTGESALAHMMEKLHELGPKRVILKKGEDGCVYYNGQDYFFVPSFPVKDVKDPTGAGDSFAGGFMGFCAQSGARNEKDFRRAVVFGSVMASFAIEDFSVNGIKDLTKEDIEQRYKKFIEISHI